VCRACCRDREGGRLFSASYRANGSASLQDGDLAGRRRRESGGAVTVPKTVGWTVGVALFAGSGKRDRRGEIVVGISACLQALGRMEVSVSPFAIEPAMLMLRIAPEPPSLVMLDRSSAWRYPSSARSGSHKTERRGLRGRNIGTRRGGSDCPQPEQAAAGIAPRTRGCRRPASWCRGRPGPSRSGRSTSPIRRANGSFHSRV
jgi:hypothetical protein